VKLVWYNTAACLLVVVVLIRKIHRDEISPLSESQRLRLSGVGRHCCNVRTATHLGRQIRADHELQPISSRDSIDGISVSARSGSTNLRRAECSRATKVLEGDVVFPLCSVGLGLWRCILGLVSDVS
jgi:hypothetical protein